MDGTQRCAAAAASLRYRVPPSRGLQASTPRPAALSLTDPAPLRPPAAAAPARALMAAWQSLDKLYPPPNWRPPPPAGYEDAQVWSGHLSV